MTEDQIKQFAHESGLTDKDLGDWMTDYGLCKGAILAFAELIAKAEREECAKVADEKARRNFTWSSENSDRYNAQADWADVIAKAIRARGDK